MKKLLSVFILLLTYTIFLNSCTPKSYTPYTSLVYTSANDGFEIKSDVDFWNGTYFEKKNMKDQTCKLFEKTYNGAYTKSITDKMNSYTTDIYLDQDGVEFGLRNDNGNLTFINLMNAEFFNTEPYLEESIGSYEAAVPIAKQIAGEYISNIEEYEQFYESPITRYKEKDGITYKITYYTVTFARKINNYFSSDYISVKVTSKGNLASIMMGDIGAFEKLNISIDSSELSKSISTKIQSSYSSSEFKNTKSNIEDQKIAITPNGYICIYSDIKLDITDTSNNKKETGLVIITIIDDIHKA